MLFDWLYWLLFGIGMALSLFASFRVKSTFRKYSQLTTRSGMTGAEVAQRILRDNGIHDVQVEPVHGKLTDHYDPKSKVLRLSEPVYGGQSMAAFGVAAHEVGHAIQDAHHYGPLKFRSAIVPVAGLGTSIGIWVLIASLFLGGMANTMGALVGTIGLLLFGGTFLFTLVTLPVEFDASKRALVALNNGGYTTVEEMQGAKKVLDAAALTYVAAAVSSLLMLFYWLIRLGVIGGNRN